MPTIRNDKREAKNRRQKVVAGRTRQRERRWNGDEIEGWGERERDSLLGEEKIRASSRRSQVGAGREKSIPRGAESGGAVWRGGATPFFGVHGGENDNWSSWQRPSHLVSILPRPLRLPTNPSNPQTSPRDLSCLPHPLSLSRRALSIVFREGAERMALAKSRSLPFEDLPTGGHLPPSIPPLGKSARG